MSEANFESVSESPMENLDRNQAIAGKSTSEKCESCLEIFEIETLFKCTTCMDKQEEATNSVDFYCEVCIGSHLRKGHTLLDHKSLQPAVCGLHKNLCSLFCSTCEEILCTNCVVKHTNHSIMSVKEKATEARAIVFEMIAELDASEKSVRSTMERINENKETRLNEYEQLVLRVSSVFDQMKQKVLDRIKVDHEKLARLENDSTGNYDFLLNCQKDLRELLSCSEANMVKQLGEKKKEVELIKAKQLQLQSSEIKGTRCTVSENADGLVNKFTDDYLGNVEMPTIAAFEYITDLQNELGFQESFVHSYNCIGVEVYYVRSDGNRISVSKCNFADCEDGVKISKVEFANYQCDYPVQKLRTYNCVGDLPRIMVWTEKEYLVFKVEKEYCNGRINVTYSFTEVKVQLGPTQIPLYFTAVMNDVAHFLYWDKREKQIKQTNKIEVSFRCDSLPRTFNSYKDDMFVHFIDEANNIVEIDTHLCRRNNINEIIKASLHKVDHISSISFLEDTLIIWSVPASSLTFLRKSAAYSPYKILKAVSIVSQFHYFTVKVPGVNSRMKFLVTAKIEDENGHLIDKNVFVIKK